MTTAGDKPSIIGSAITAWRDGFAAVAQMPVVFGIATLIMLVLNFVNLQLTPPIGEGEVPGVGIQLLTFIYGIVQGFFVTPVAIAVHRFVLLGEVTARYNLNPSDPRFLRFFIFTAVLQFLVTIPSTLLTFSVGGLEGVAAFAIGLAGFVLLIVALIVSLRSLILFPAIAVDAPGADWKNALADTKGHSWRVFFIFMVTFLPPVLVMLLAFLILGWPGAESSSTVGLAVAQSVLGVATLAALASLASRLYAAFSVRLGRPAGLQAGT